jgi:hypothetical protein
MCLIVVKVLRGAISSVSTFIVAKGQIHDRVQPGSGIAFLWPRGVTDDGYVAGLDAAAMTGVNGEITRQ